MTEYSKTNTILKRDKSNIISNMKTKINDKCVICGTDINRQNELYYTKKIDMYECSRCHNTDIDINIESSNHVYDMIIILIFIIITMIIIYKIMIY